MRTLHARHMPVTSETLRLSTRRGAFATPRTLAYSCIVASGVPSAFCTESCLRARGSFDDLQHSMSLTRAGLQEVAVQVGMKPGHAARFADFMEQARG